MDLYKDKYIIVEIIPTHSNPNKGMIIQISALKLDGIQLIDRFDYRIEEQSIENQDLKEMISYDKELFTYVDSSESILNSFKNWIMDYPLLILDEVYTPNYLEKITNKKEILYPYLDLEYSSDVFDKIINKYHLQPSNHLVDLAYEAIIYEGRK